MNAQSVQFESDEGGLVLANAILLYRPERRDLGSGREAAFASIHDVEHQAGQPVIAAGAPLTHAHLRHWTRALGRSAPPEILPDNILVSHADIIAWWVPAKVRAAYFDLSRPTASLKALSARTTVRVPYPAHLFVATRRGLGVFALRESRRPDAATPLLYSPVLNVFISGDLCWGNIAKPKAPTIAAIPDYERAVFDSWSTHPNAGQETTVSGKGGLVALWDELAARRAASFPVDRLKPFELDHRRKGAAPVTLGTLVGRVAQ